MLVLYLFLEKLNCIEILRRFFLLRARVSFSFTEHRIGVIQSNELHTVASTNYEDFINANAVASIVLEIQNT